MLVDSPPSSVMRVFPESPNNNSVSIMLATASYVLFLPSVVEVSTGMLSVPDIACSFSMTKEWFEYRIHEIILSIKSLSILQLTGSHETRWAPTRETWWKLMQTFFCRMTSIFVISSAAINLLRNYKQAKQPKFKLSHHFYQWKNKEGLIHFAFGEYASGRIWKELVDNLTIEKKAENQ